MDTITVKIYCSSETCEELREEGLFFTTIAEALGIGRDNVVELEDEEKNSKDLTHIAPIPRQNFRKIFS